VSLPATIGEIGSCLWLLVPGYAELPFIGYVSLPATIGEIGSCLWLLVLGARERQPVAE
jgi:hypothetical protein